MTGEDFYPLPAPFSGVENGLGIILYYNNSDMEKESCKSFFKGYRV